MQQTFIAPCPCFPGFYHTALFDPDVLYYAVDGSLKELADLYFLPAELLKECERRFGNILTVNDLGFEHDVATEFVSCVEEYLNEALESGCTLKLRNIDRPTFYNYRNDIAVIEATFDPEEVITYCREHDLCYEPNVELWGGGTAYEVLETVLKDYIDREYIEDAEQRLCREALEDYVFDDYIGTDPKIGTALDSDEVYELGKEYERELARCDAYVEAMHNTPRSRKLADNARKKIRDVYPERLAELLGLPVEKKEVESDMVTVDLFA